MSIQINDNIIEVMLKHLNSLQSDDVNSEGNVFGYVYSLGNDFNNLFASIHRMFMHSTGLDVKAFPSAAYLENNVIGTLLELTNAPKDAQGTFTSGGTESIILSVKSLRDHPKNRGVENPCILIPENAHPAFIKACRLLKVNTMILDVDPVSYKASYSILDSYKKDKRPKSPNSFTYIGMVASAPAYGTGIMDDIEEISKIALHHDIDLIVDACVGGMILPFASNYKWGFELDGVSIITMDMHKYGYAPKGSSAVLYRHGKEYKDAQTFTLSSWLGYSIINSGLANTKSVSSLACTYAVMALLKRRGYENIAHTCLLMAEEIKNAIKSIEGISIVGNPDLNLFAIQSDKKSVSPIDVFLLAEEMNKYGWYIQAQLGYKSIESSIHISVGYQNIHKSYKFIDDLIKSCEEIRGEVSKSFESTIVDLDISRRDKALRNNYQTALDASNFRLLNTNSLSSWFLGD